MENSDPITKENILEKTKFFLVKSQALMEKSKDVPRYRTVVQYEGEFKETYKIGLGVALKTVLKKYSKLVKENDFTTSPDTGTA